MHETLPLTVAAALSTAQVTRHEALMLLAHASGWSREQLLAGSDDRLSDAVSRAFVSFVERRRDGEPIAYLLGRREFYGRDFSIDPRALIPRPETELLVDLSLAWLAGRSTGLKENAPRVLDVGTGTGVIAITLALEAPSSEVTATDVSTDALDVAIRNAERLRAPVKFIESDWFDAFESGERPPQFDLIVSNPPYIAAGDPHLSMGDLRFEPPSALTGGADGLQAIRRIVAGSGAMLTSDGCLMLEHGHDQAGAIRELLLGSGFDRVMSWRDLAGIERVTGGVRASVGPG